MRDPVPHRAKLLGDEPIAAFAAVPSLGDETGIKQDAEMLRDGWAAHLELPRNRADGALSLDKEIKHPAARGMADSPKDIRLAIGPYYHVTNIRKLMLTRQVRNGHYHLGGDS